MAKKAMIEKWSKEPKFPVRQYNRCKICFREQSYKGAIPGVTKASW